MAISPQDARKLNPTDLVEAQRLERAIDVFLSREYKKNSGTPPSFELNRDRMPNQAIIDELIKRYTAAGWVDVKLNSGRDGDCLQFWDVAV